MALRNHCLLDYNRFIDILLTEHRKEASPVLRLFVTGDHHIGLKYASHPKAAQLSAARLEAFTDIVACANGENCGLFVITGDLFENTYSVARKDIRALLQILSEFHGTVAILPGNHDYYDEDTKLWTWFREELQTTDNIVLLNEKRPYPLCMQGEQVVLYPAPCKSLHSEPGKNNLGWIRETQFPENAAYRIGIAHGAVEGETIDREGQYFLMRRRELEEIAVDVWLLGHTHVPFPRDLTEQFTGGNRIFNPGTHVQTDVSCNTEGLCFVVQIDDDKTVLAKRVPSGKLRFCRIHAALQPGKMETQLQQALQPLSDETVVDLILSGAVTAEEYETRFSLTDRLLSRFVEGTERDTDLSKLISRSVIEAEFPETSFSAKFLTALLDEPKEAQLAYELLTALKEGK